MKALTSMSMDMKKIYGDNLSEVVLYGSYARGTETPESDVDIVLFLNVKATDKEHDAMTDTVVDYELEQGKTLSVITVEVDHFKESKDILPFYRNIQKEGVVLWKKI
ncbi:MAG: nucleotidyltransferase domain-containing protein [Lachnospiraceae bacterium]|nr:nucleotidyltransferase domain-containing protein [Lachnospiraceae bacterium]